MPIALTQYGVHACIHDIILRFRNLIEKHVWSNGPLQQ